MHLCNNQTNTKRMLKILATRRDSVAFMLPEHSRQVFFEAIWPVAVSICTILVRFTRTQGLPNALAYPGPAVREVCGLAGILTLALLWCSKKARALPGLSNRVLLRLIRQNSTYRTRPDEWSCSVGSRRLASVRCSRRSGHHRTRHLP